MLPTKLKAVIFVLPLILLVSCESLHPKPYVRSSAHIDTKNSPTADPGTDIPALVDASPVLANPTPSLTSYTIVANSVPLDDLLFKLARDTQINIDIDPKIQGTVTLNAVQQTLPEILKRLAEQYPIRYEFTENNLLIQLDKPYLKTYPIDYVNIRRNTDSSNITTTQITSTGSDSSSSSSNSNSITTVDSESVHDFWQKLAQTISAVLGIEPHTRSNTQTTIFKSDRIDETSARSQEVEAEVVPNYYWDKLVENISVISNPEAGLLIVRATKRQHDKIAEIIEQIMNNVKRQVLIQTTIVEVILNNKYQAGIDWGYIKRNSGSLIDISANILANTLSNTLSGLPINDTNSFVIDIEDTNQSGFSAMVQLLDEFGDAKILSSPQIMVLNNHTALLKVVENAVYFEVDAQTTISGTSGTTNSTIDTTAKTVPIGIVMTVSPQIDAHGMVTINVRPTITRQIGEVRDPNPELVRNNIENLVPEIAVREMESILRLANGQIGVLGGLMQDSIQHNNAGIPGISREPGIGNLFKSTSIQQSKTELVIFIRPIIIKNPSIETDLELFKAYLEEKHLNQPYVPSKSKEVDP